MRDAIELLMEAQRIWRAEENAMLVQGLELRDVLQCVTALECAQVAAQRPAGSQAGLEFRPADLQAVRDFVDAFPDLSATAAQVYFGIHQREATPAEARSVAVALRRLGLVSARSNGRTIWRHK